MDNLDGVLVASISDGELKFGSDMSDEAAWALLMMALVSQSHKLELENSSVHELLDVALEHAEEQTQI